MRYAAVLNGQADVFEYVAPCFASETARIKKLGDTWILESSAFDSCMVPADVFPIADTTLLLIHRILALYSGLSSPFSIAYIQSFNAEGLPSGRGLRAIQEITVYSSIGISTLANPSGALPLGSVIADRAASDSAISEALNLRGVKDLGWSQIYDIIEFLGGANKIAGAGLTTRSRARDIRQTANHYRHLGSPKDYPLPAKPPTINQAKDLCRRSSEGLDRGPTLTVKP